VLTSVAARRRLPIPERARLLTSFVLVFCDFAALLACVAGVGLLPAGMVFAVSAFTWWCQGLYARRFTLSLLDDLPVLFVGVACGLTVASVLAWGWPFLIPWQPGTVPVYAGAVLFVATVVCRAVGYSVIRGLRARGYEVFPTLLVGWGSTAEELCERIQSHPTTGIRPVGILRKSPSISRDRLPYPVLGPLGLFERVVSARPVTDVIVCDHDLPRSELVELLRTFSRTNVTIHVVPDVFEMHRSVVTTDHVWSLPLERVHRHDGSRLARASKRLIDVVVAVAALALLSPLLLLLALAVRLELGAPVIFRQERVGLDGRRFTVRKFRSMRHCPVGSHAPWHVSGGDRIGPVGRLIRKYSLDELPQLLNVLVGDMSLVGPRPERPEYVDRFSVDVPGYQHRHRVRVGLTGLAAVEGLRGDTSLRDRAYFDNYYIEHWSLWLDLKILVRTVLAVLRGTGN